MMCYFKKHLSIYRGESLPLIVQFNWNKVSHLTTDGLLYSENITSEKSRTHEHKIV